jgi:site-specific recombinase XerD
MTVPAVLDSAGRRCSPATMPGYTTREGGRVTRASYPADPATVEEIVAAMRHAREDRRGWRLRALIVVLWRARLRVQEALALSERDLDARRGSLLVRQGNGGRRRDISAWTTGAGTAAALARCPPRAPGRAAVLRHRRSHLRATLVKRRVRGEFRRLAAQAGVRRRFAPHQLRHAHAVELARERAPLNVIPRQLGHAKLGTISIYLQGIDTDDIIATVHARRAPMMSASAELQI